jgi:hypothetical protein
MPSKRHPTALSPNSAFSVLRAVFTHRLKLERKGSRLRLVLRRPGATAGPRHDADMQDNPLQAALMLDDLRSLLDGAPGIRKVLRHLAAVEHHLKRRGTASIGTLPLRVLHQAVRQLDSLAMPPVPPGLQKLRTALLQAIGTQEEQIRQAGLRAPISSFLGEHRLQVKEASLAEFDRIAAELQLRSSPAAPRKA